MKSKRQLRRFRPMIGTPFCPLLATDRASWDEQISHDFSEGGAGMKLLAEIDERIDRGDFTPLE